MSMVNMYKFLGDHFNTQPLKKGPKSGPSAVQAEVFLVVQDMTEELL